jgi:DNA-binding NarL/FixJ family response regulator
MEKEEFETVRDLLILLLLKSGVSYEAIAEVTGSNVKTIQNRFPIGSITRKRENV